MVPVASLDFRTDNGRKVLELFCTGSAPSEIDERMGLLHGTSRHTISSWWLEDKIYRVGQADDILLEMGSRRGSR